MKKNILFLMSGSIACYKACGLISKLVQAGMDVKTAVTPAALNFVGPATLEGLTSHPTVTDIFATGTMMNHIHLNRWADAIILCPASANTINKMAAGIGDDVVTTLYLAHDFQKPFWVVPAMNSAMLKHPATQKSLKILQEQGLKILETNSGTLACGETGEGKLLEPEQIFQIVTSEWNKPVKGKALKVLITSGGTREPIDGVRFIGNASTGSTGATIADYFAEQGHNVTFLHAQNSKLPTQPVEAKTFVTFDDLDHSLQELLEQNDFDGVIHAAAVSDFSVQKVLRDGRPVQGTSKLPSSQNLELILQGNKKIIEHLRAYARNPNFILVGFKLTQGASESARKEAVRQLFTKPGLDFVVQNDLSEVNELRHPAVIYDRDKVVRTVENKYQMAEALEKMMVGFGGGSHDLVS